MSMNRVLYTIVMFQERHFTMEVHRQARDEVKR
jgi:hypothetical protein